MNNPSLISCNAIIAGFIHNGLFEEAVLLFSELRLFGLKPTSVTMLSVIQGCVGLESVGMCGCIHGYVVKIGLDLNISVVNSVLYMYLSLGNLDIATDVFDKMASRDVISWTTMIGFLVRIEQASNAVKVFHRMRENGIDPDMVALVNLLTACSLLGDLMRGRLVHNQIVVAGFGSEITVVNSLITMYSKCGDLYFARRYEQNGDPREALRLLIRMRIEENFSPDPILLISSVTVCGQLAALELCKQFHAYIFGASFVSHNSVQNSLVGAYLKCGDVELAHKVFNEISCKTIVLWNAIISGYGINGKGEAAVALFRDMEKSGKEPDNVTYLNVLNAHSHSGLVDNGLMIFNQNDERKKKVRLRGEHCGCIVDMLSRAGFEEAESLRSNMRLKGLVKNQGVSLLDVTSCNFG
ncbi:pentatricopeptide repeat-containing protein At1g11290, chloroplastic-like [Tasmannia lanceolata]|uniref:pentatricopeptide repeat-containing protein At1g11290, chloroplastic-like n=1 Tax=Tasmannia lanceolata TaxID=3420 RepID=UPI0040639EDC